MDEIKRAKTKIKQSQNGKESTAWLKKQLAWYKSFFENSTDAVFIIEPESWEVLDVNNHSSVLLGLKKEQLVGMTIPQFRRIFKLLNKSNSPVVLSELPFDTAEGTLMAEISARFVHINGKKMIQAIVRDVSEQYALTDKLVQADKLVLMGQLTASVAHEIRNPLAAVNLNLQILQRKIPNEAPESNQVRTALQGVERISKIVDVTLNFSRSSLPDIQKIQINSLLPVTLELFHSVTKRKEIYIELKLTDSLPYIEADSKQLQQVFINLIKNAADAISEKGSIIIKTYLEKNSSANGADYLVVSISDTGTGIPPEDLPKIFNPFFTRKAEGTGLGLPITQRILHQYGGIIDVESNLGIGTTFYVKLPAYKKA